MSRRGWGVITVVLFAVMLGGSANAKLPPEAARLEKALRSVESLEADFVQIRSLALTGEELEASGKLAFKPPQGFRLAFRTPEPQELVVKDNYLWVIMPAENQAQRYEFDPLAPGNEVFLLFGGKERSLEEAFHWVEEPWGPYAAALRLTPRENAEGYPLEEIRLVVGEDGFPKKLFFHETSGDDVIFNFIRFRQNPKNIDDLVALHVPEGMEIIDAAPASQGGSPVDPDR